MTLMERDCVDAKLEERIGSLLYHLGQQRVGFQILEEQTPLAWPEVLGTESDMLTLLGQLSAWLEKPSDQNATDLERTVRSLEKLVRTGANLLVEFAEKYGVDLSSLAGLAPPLDLGRW